MGSALCAQHADQSNYENMRRYLAYYFSLGTLSSLVQKSEALRQGKRSEFNVALDEGDFDDPLADIIENKSDQTNNIQQKDGHILSDTFDQIRKSISDKIESGIIEKISSSSESDVTDSFYPEEKTNIDPEIEILENCYNNDYECTKQDLEAWFPIKTQAYWEHYNKLFNNCKWQAEFSTEARILCNQLGTNKCINLYNDFTCDCKTGFTGDLCQDDLREETFVSKCLNGDQDQECTRQEIKSLFFEPLQKE